MTLRDSLGLYQEQLEGDWISFNSINNSEMSAAESVFSQIQS